MMDEEVMVRRLMALLEQRLGPVEGARPILTIVKEQTSEPVKEPPMQRPPIFAIGPMEARLRAASK
jgi:hypothetical protein